MSEIDAPRARLHALRGHPRYQILMAHWMDLINAERAKLGLDPLELNREAGPGNLPFLMQWSK